MSSPDDAGPIVPRPECRFPRAVDSDAQLSDAVAWVAWANAEAEAIDADAERRCQTIKAAAARRIAKLRSARIDNAGLQIDRYVVRNRRRLLADGKTLRLAGGVVQVRRGNEAVAIVGKESESEVVDRIAQATGADRAIAEALEGAGAATWLRVSLALNRERIKRDVGNGVIDSSALATHRLKIERPESIRVSRAA